MKTREQVLAFITEKITNKQPITIANGFFITNGFIYHNILGENEIEVNDLEVFDDYDFTGIAPKTMFDFGDKEVYQFVELNTNNPIVIQVVVE